MSLVLWVIHGSYDKQLTFSRDSFFTRRDLVSHGLGDSLSLTYSCIVTEAPVSFRSGPGPNLPWALEETRTLRH